MPGEINNDLVLVIPAVVEDHADGIRVDGDFANNLAAYLDHFDRVDVYCPDSATYGSFPSVRLAKEIAPADRLAFHVLPIPYREDRYLRHYRAVRKRLQTGLRAARYRLISPHAPFNWSSLAAAICVAEGLKFNFENDADLAQIGRYEVGQQPFGLRKLYHRARLEWHLRRHHALLRQSTLSLVQGADVFAAYRDIAPNAHAVLNIQITEKDRIAASELEQKIARVRGGAPLRLFYAGRALEIKGPLQWLDVLRRAREAGIAFSAEWVGDGEMLAAMRQRVADHGLSAVCTLPGNVAKSEVMTRMRRADLFLFCHMADESPRCLMEAVACGAPLCGFATDYSRSLVAPHGGGVFAERGDTQTLADHIERLDKDRDALADLISQCARSGRELDRDRAILQRITLMKRYL